MKISEVGSTDEFVRSIIGTLKHNLDDEPIKVQIYAEIIMAYEDNIDVDLSKYKGIDITFDHVLTSIGCEEK